MFTLKKVVTFLKKKLDLVAINYTIIRNTVRVFRGNYISVCLLAQLFNVDGSYFPGT